MTLDIRPTAGSAPSVPADLRARHAGLTSVIDSGLPLGLFTDIMTSHAELIDLVKFGWGTALVSRDIDRKVALLRELGIGCYLGGTLFERFVWTGRYDDYARLVASLQLTHVEVSNGTIPMEQAEKAGWIRRVAAWSPVLSEVGFKDASRTLAPGDWVEAVRSDLDAGASLVITETRESGRAGIATADGRLRGDVLSALLRAVDPGRLLFEAPTKDLQVELISELGADVHLGNISPHDVVGLETLRHGLRADTLLRLVPPGPGR